MELPFRFPPRRPGLWVALNERARAVWLDKATDRAFSKRRPPPAREPGRTVQIDGALIDSLSGFFCAIGEAVNGPGGYFGSQMTGFYDCLFGGFGLEAPYTIVWRNHEVSRRVLGRAAYRHWLANPTSLEAELRSLEEAERTAGRAAAADNDDMTMFDTLVSNIRSVPGHQRRVRWDREILVLE